MFMDKTLKSILEDPRISRIAPDAIKRWDLTKEEFYNWTLREIAEKMGWKCLNRGFTRLFEADERIPDFLDASWLGADVTGLKVGTVILDKGVGHENVGADLASPFNELLLTLDILDALEMLALFDLHKLGF